MNKHRDIRNYKGLPATRSSIKRMENEVKKLRNHLDELVTKRIYKPEESRGNEVMIIEDLKETIEKKEEIILQLKLLL
jgi:archaellum component FlaC